MGPAKSCETCLGLEEEYENTNLGSISCIFGKCENISLTKTNNEGFCQKIEQIFIRIEIVTGTNHRIKANVRFLRNLLQHKLDFLG